MSGPCSLAGEGAGDPRAMRQIPRPCRLLCWAGRWRSGRHAAACRPLCGKSLKAGSGAGSAERRPLPAGALRNRLQSTSVRQPPVLLRRSAVTRQHHQLFKIASGLFKHPIKALGAKPTL